MKATIITLLSIICIIFAVAGCTQSQWLYRVNVQQGNVIAADMVQQLRIGMSKEEVCELIGPPVLMDAFNDNRWIYIHTFKPGKGKYIQRKLIIYFRNNRIDHMNATKL